MAVSKELLDKFAVVGNLFARQYELNRQISKIKQGFEADDNIDLLAVAIEVLTPSVLKNTYYSVSAENVVDTLASMLDARSSGEIIEAIAMVLSGEWVAEFQWKSSMLTDGFHQLHISRQGDLATSLDFHPSYKAVAPDVARLCSKGVSRDGAALKVVYKTLDGGVTTAYFYQGNIRVVEDKTN